MPPRRRPGSPAPNSHRQDVSRDSNEQLGDFARYLGSECGLAQNSIKAYRSDLQQFISWLDRQSGVKGSYARLRQVDLETLSSYLHHLHERSLAAASIARQLVSLKMFFRYLVLEGVLTESAVELLNSPKLWQRLPHVLSPDTVNRLLAAPNASDSFALRDRAFLALLYATGCRVTEVANLCLRDIHLDEGFCRCLGKGNKERLVSLNPVALTALTNYLQHQRAELSQNRNCDSLFLSRTGRSLTRIMLWKLVKKYARRIGASDQVSPHTLRHSFATHMLAGGAEIRALQELLGHASIATTQLYTHVESSRLKTIHSKCHPRG